MNQGNKISHNTIWSFRPLTVMCMVGDNSPHLHTASEGVVIEYSARIVAVREMFAMD